MMSIMSSVKGASSPMILFTELILASRRVVGWSMSSRINVIRPPAVDGAIYKNRRRR